jgi:hypothetical protein
MSDKKQTAVEWLMLNLHTSKDPFGTAKAMEKEQMFEYIKSMYVNGEESLKFHKEEFEQYYTETHES